MRRLALVLPLLSGCFTTAGGLIGGVVADPVTVQTPTRGLVTYRQTRPIAIGLAIGILLDVAAIIAISQIDFEWQYGCPDPPDCPPHY